MLGCSGSRDPGACPLPAPPSMAFRHCLNLHDGNKILTSVSQPLFWGWRRRVIFLLQTHPVGVGEECSDVFLSSRRGG